MAEKVRTASIIAKKFLGDIEICCNGGADVQGPVDSKGAGGTEGVEEAGDVGSGAVTAGAVDAGILGSSIGTGGDDRASTGWSSAGSSSARSWGGRL